MPFHSRRTAKKPKFKLKIKTKKIKGGELITMEGYGFPKKGFK